VHLLMNSALWAHMPHLKFFISVAACCSHTGHFTSPLFTFPYILAGLVHSTSRIHFYNTRISTAATVPSSFFISSVATPRRTPSLHCDWPAETCLLCYFL